MRLLLDSHAFLWFIDDAPALSSNARQLIEDGANEVLLSVASVWEMGIKISIGKLALPQPFETFITEQVSLNDFALLNISVKHAAAVATLPFHHRDPFDRLLVAQALVEQIPILSRDAALDSYGVTRLW